MASPANDLLPTVLESATKLPKGNAMKRSVVITTLLLLAALSHAHGAECDTNIEVTQDRKVVLPERVHSSRYGRRGLWLQNTGEKDVLCAVGAKTKRRLLPGDIWEEKSPGGNLKGDLEFQKVTCVTSHGTATLKGCDY
jgi:hypothetical protein